MNSSQIAKIIKLNNTFYKNVAQKFSQTRGYSWAGWKKLLPIITNINKLSVIDLGCGNGRFFTFLCQNIQSTTFEYLGIDKSDFLLKTAKENCKIFANNGRKKDQLNTFNFKKGNIFNVLEHPTTKFSLVVGFGITHHIPDSAFRINWFKEVLKLSKKQGYIVFSFWYPNINKSLKKVPSYFEEGDFLFNFDLSLLPRYVHVYSKKELSLIVDLYAKNGFKLVKKYKSDLSNNSYNVYLVFKNV